MKKTWSLIVACLATVAWAMLLVGCGAPSPSAEDESGILLSYVETPSSAYTVDIRVRDTESFLLSVPTREGYTFAGLYDASVGGVKVVDENGRFTFSPTHDVKLWAQWIPDAYTIVFDAAEGTVVGASERTVLYDSVLTSFPVPTRDGYDFVGWRSGAALVCGADGLPSSECSRFNFMLYTPDADGRVQLQAQWTRRMLTVVFDYADGVRTPDTLTVEYGHTLPLASLPRPVENGRAVRAWSYTQNGLSPVTADIVAMREDVTLYAVWDGYVSVDFVVSKDVTETERIFEHEPYTVPTPKRDGYRFLGWYTTEDGSGVPVDRMDYATAQPTYYAKWELITYTVSYDANGATLGATAETLLRSAENGQALTPNGFTHPSFIFDSWNTAPDGSGVRLLDRQTVGFIPGAEDGHVTLYAQWRTKKFTVHLDYRNPSKHTVVEMTDCAVTSTEVYYGQSYALPTPACQYFTFLGWEIGGLVCSAEDLWTLDVGADGSSITVYAVWKREVDLSKPLTFERVPEEPIRITDENDRQNAYRIATGLDRNMLMAYGYTGYVLTVTVEITEIEDGYQHVIIRNPNNESEALKDFVIEHGPGRKDTSTYEHTVSAVLPVNQMDYYGGIRIHFSAHGNGADDWLLGKTTYTLTFNP